MPGSAPAAGGQNPPAASAQPPTEVPPLSMDAPSVSSTQAPPPSVVPGPSAMPKLPPRIKAQPATPSTTSRSASAPLTPPSTPVGPPGSLEPPSAASGAPTTATGTTSAPTPSRAGPSLPARPQPASHPRPASTASNGLPPHGAPGPALPAAAPQQPPQQGTPAGPAQSSPSAAAAATAAAPPAPRHAMPVLPQRQVAPAMGPVLDPNEPPETAELRRQVHSVRVLLLRAAKRLGSDPENAMVKQVMYRLRLAEKLKAPWHGRGQRPDPERAALRDAARLEAEEDPDAPGGLQITVLLVGMSGVGKTALIHSLLNRPGAAVDTFGGGTDSVHVVRGTVYGMRMVFIDTPGLHVAASQATRNARILRSIEGAKKRHQPDLVLYVDRMDKGSGGRPEAAGELPALHDLSMALGPSLWLNTIIALTHAGTTPPQDSRAAVPYDMYAHQRCTQLQKVIRAASGDDRLMNPVAFVDSHPACRINAGGQPVVGSGIPWKPHLYLMIVAAKLLADTETMLQVRGGGGGGGAGLNGSLSAQQQSMLAAQQRQMPLAYLVQQATQFSRPLEYPGHDAVMAVRDAQRRAALSSRHPAEQRLLMREVRGRLRQARAAQQQASKLGAQSKTATLAGGKVVPEPPRLARRAAAGTAPPATYRHRVTEATNGWVVRPHIEQHGLDNSDGIEGLYMDKTGVVRPSSASSPVSSKPYCPSDDAPPEGGGRKGRRPRRQRDGAPPFTAPGCDGGGDVLGGVPFHHSVSAQCSKQQCLLQGRSEATLYHDPMGRLTTSLSADAQTSGAPGAVDAIVTLRADARRSGTVCRGNATTLGAQLTRVLVGGRPHRGPLAYGMRLQDTYRGELCGSPLDISAALSGMASHTPGGMVAGERCLGANVEATFETQGLLGSGRSVPLTVNLTNLRYKGESTAALGAMLALRGEGKRDSLVARVQVSSRNRAGVSMRAHSGRHWWLGLAFMTWPLSTWVLELRERRRRRLAAGKNALVTRPPAGALAAQAAHA